jgi:hypothetical protein
VVKLRRGLTARVFAECEDMRDVYSWFLVFLQDLQEKALLQVEQDDPTRQVRTQHGKLLWHGMTFTTQGGG